MVELSNHPTLVQGQVQFSIAFLPPVALDWIVAPGIRAAPAVRNKRWSLRSC